MATLQPVHRTNAPALFFAGTRMTMHLTGEQTGGQFCLLENLIPPGYATPPHLHENEDEAFLILEGELDVIVGGQALTVRAGESAFAPRGIPHQLRNAGNRPVRAMVLSTPAGFGEFVTAAGVPATDGAPPAPVPEQLAATAARFGIRIPA